MEEKDINEKWEKFKLKPEHLLILIDWLKGRGLNGGFINQYILENEWMEKCMRLVFSMKLKKIGR